MKNFVHSRWGRLLFVALGLALFVWLFLHIGVRDALEQARRIGWMFLWIFLLGAVPHLLRTVSWFFLLRPGGDTPPFRRLFAWWLSGEAISHLSFSWSGEAYRVVVARPQVDTARGAVAMGLNRAVYSLASLAVAAVGLTMALGLPRLPESLHRAIFVFLILFALVVVGVAILLLRSARRRRARVGAANAAAPAEETSPSRLRRLIRELRWHIDEMAGQGRAALTWLFAVNVLTALVGVVEVWLILYALGERVGFAEALFIESFLKLLSGLAYFVPGNIGIAEGGIVLILNLLDISAAAGLALALIRRARALAWVGVGGLVLLALGRPARPPAEPNAAAG